MRHISFTFKPGSENNGVFNCMHLRETWIVVVPLPFQRVQNKILFIQNCCLNGMCLVLDVPFRLKYPKQVFWIPTPDLLFSLLSLQPVAPGFPVRCGLISSIGCNDLISGKEVSRETELLTLVFFVNHNLCCLT